MAEKDSLNADSFNRVIGSGPFLKFRADVPLTLRILTTDPVISETEFTDKKTGEITLSTRFAFIVYNFTEEKAQILQASPAMARKFGEYHNDPDFGSNIRKIDIKITPTGEGLERRYDIQILPKPRTLTQEMVEEAQALDIDNMIKNSKGRMSGYNQDMSGSPVGSSGSGYASAKKKADELKAKKEQPVNDEAAAAEAEAARADKEAAENPDPVIEDIGEEPPNLDDIPF